GNPRVALIASAGAAVADEMLGRGDQMARPEEIPGADLALDAGDHLPGISGLDTGIFRIAFVTTPPAIVAPHRERRGERPVEACCGGLLCGDRADLADQLGIARRAEADIVGEEGGADD